jgi:hypothetical protein
MGDGHREDTQSTAKTKKSAAAGERRAAEKDSVGGRIQTGKKQTRERIPTGEKRTAGQGISARKTVQTGQRDTTDWSVTCRQGIRSKKADRPSPAGQRDRTDWPVPYGQRIRSEKTVQTGEAATVQVEYLWSGGRFTVCVAGGVSPGRKSPAGAVHETPQGKAQERDYQ